MEIEESKMQERMGLFVGTNSLRKKAVWIQCPGERISFREDTGHSLEIKKDKTFADINLEAQS